MGSDVKTFLKITIGTTGIITFIVIYITLQKEALPFEVPQSWFPPPRLVATSHSVSMLRHQCTDVITNMLHGQWEENNVTEKERLDMYNYYEEVLKTRGVQYGIQRPDRQCGNVYNDWYRALCHPGGPTPCCYDSVCVNSSLHNCSCPRCFDLRDQIEADLATWRAQNEACQPRKMAVEEICTLLGNASVYFIGDSLVRHLYLAFAMLAKGTEDKVFHHTNMEAELSSLCRGRLLFSNIKCRPVVHHSPVLCNGAVRTKFMELRNIGKTKQIVTEILSLGNLSRSLVVFGIGVDDKYNPSEIQHHIWTPLLLEMQSKNLTKPKIVWTTPHIIGPIKAVAKDYRADYDQDHPHVHNYTHEMVAFLKQRGIPVLSSYNITMGVMSHDGIHHGMGVNKLRAQVLLHHIEELASLGQW
ncbi:uncharacterized protein [Littorina saxatilis]|uniref:uncharacterized protein n=1 Tax=Littorina saxatilis TaxID=31220 RepID=UPI0038B47041